MADTGIFCNQGDMLAKAGAGVSTTLNAATDTTFTYSNSFITQAESFINVAAKYNFSDTYSSLNVDVKGILREAASCMAAMYAIQYDMSGYTSREEAQTMLNVLSYRFQDCLAQLKEKDKTAFISGA